MHSRRSKIVHIISDTFPFPGFYLLSDLFPFFLNESGKSQLPEKNFICNQTVYTDLIWVNKCILFSPHIWSKCFIEKLLVPSARLWILPYVLSDPDPVLRRL